MQENLYNLVTDLIAKYRTRLKRIKKAEGRIKQWNCEKAYKASAAKYTEVFLADLRKITRASKGIGGLKYWIVYLPDISKNFTLEVNKEGEMLDYIMSLEDGDLANYEIFLRII